MYDYILVVDGVPSVSDFEDKFTESKSIPTNICSYIRTYINMYIEVLYDLIHMQVIKGT